MHAGWNVLAKRKADPTAFLLAMEAMTLLLLTPVLMLFVPLSEISLEVAMLVGATSLLHALYAIWLARAYAREQLTIVYPIVQTAPALVASLAWLLLGESPSGTGMAAIALVVLGVWILRSNRSAGVGDGRLGGLHFALLALGATATYSLVDKAGMRALDDWSGHAPPAVVYIALVYLPYVIAFAGLALLDHPPRALLAGMREAIPSAAFAGLLGLAAYALVLEALRSAPVGYVVAARQASIPLASLLAVAITKERIGARRGAGLAAVTGGVGLLALA
jgi:drug/metabolite transporter (DMT)-like permease